MSANDAAPDFPKTSSEYLHKLTMGVYQLCQAAKYTDEHLNKKGDYEVHVHNDVPDLLRAKIQSRHVSSKQYYCWIQCTTDPTNPDPVTGWY